MFDATFLAEGGVFFWRPDHSQPRSDWPNPGQSPRPAPVTPAPIANEPRPAADRGAGRPTRAGIGV